jgi:iron complex outermembrane receptor protein
VKQRASESLKSKLLMSVVAMSVASAWAASARAQDPLPSQTTVGNEVAEVLVTARRRAERAQDVPIALSVIGGDQLRATDVANVRELYRQVPSLSVSIPNARNTSLLIRGVGASLANDGLVNSVGVFVDGVYYARAGSAGFDLVDLDRVEVLRGPQGTLFGKNTTAGALNIATKAPSFDLEGMGQLTLGDYGRVEARAMVSGPITDSLAFRFTAAYSRRDGFVDNVRTGDDLNDFYDRSARAQLLWRPNEDFSLRIIGDFSRQSLDCCVNIPAFVATTLANGNPFPSGLYARSALLGYTPLPIDPFARKTDIDTGQVINTVQKGISAEANLNLPGHTLTSITAYRYWSFDPYNDLDLVGLPVLLEGAFHSSSRTFTQEVRLASTGEGPISYVLGGYFLRETLFSYAVQEFGSAAGVWILPGLPAAITTPAFDGFGAELTDKPVTRSLAAFGQATWHLSDRVDLTAGLRYTDEKKHGYVMQTPFGGAPVASLPPAFQPAVQAIRDATSPPSYYAEDSRQEDNLSGTVNAAWTIAPDVLAYASYARGYKSGGINFTVLPPGIDRQVAPETADSYEVGLKTQFADRRVTLNLAAYRTDFTDYQSTRIFVNTSGSTVIFITNAGKVRTQGIEGDLTAHITPDLTLRASAAYTDAKFVSYPNAPCPQEQFQSQSCDLSGRRLPLVSKYSSYLGIDYQHPTRLFQMAGQGVMGFVNADYAWRSGFDGSTSALSGIDGYGLVNLRLGLRTEDRKTELTFWARNLFDEDYFTGLSAVAFNTGLYGAELGDPRTVGVTLRRSF